MHKYLQYILKSLVTSILLGVWLSASCGLLDDVRKNLSYRDNSTDRFYYLDSLIKNSEVDSHSYFASNLIKSELYRKQKKNVEALNCLKNIIENPNSSEFSSILGMAYLATSDVYLEEKSYKLAQNYVTEAFIIFDSLEDYNNKSLALIKSATINKQQENYQSALRNLIQAYDLYIIQGKTYEAIELAEEIGSVAYEAGEFIQAEAYLLKALGGFEQLNNPSEQIKVLETLSAICEFDKKYEDKVYYQTKLIRLSSSYDKPAKTAARMEALSSTYSKMKKRRDALQMQEKAVHLLENEESEAHYYALVKLSELYKLSNRETDAILKLHEANSLALSLENEDIIMQSTKVIAHFYRDMGDWKKAVEYLTLSDSISNQLLQTKIRRLEKNSADTRNLVDMPEMTTEVTEVTPSFFTNWKVYLAALGSLFVILVVVIITNTRKRKKTTKILEWKVYKRTKELRILNSELNTYIYKSSHDLRNPLTSIKSLLTLLKSEDINENGIKYLTLIEDCANQMDEILLNLSRAVDYKKFEVKVEQIDFNFIKDEITASEIEENTGMELSWNIREKAPFFSDPNLIKVILKKTILNSRQYRLGSSKDYCKVSITTDSTGAYLCVEDNGQGISEKVKDSVFEMFVKGTHKSKGAGLGLYLVKIASNKLRGNISLESQENKGSKIVFKLPNLA